MPTISIPVPVVANGHRKSSAGAPHIKRFNEYITRYQGESLEGKPSAPPPDYNSIPPNELSQRNSVVSNKAKVRLSDTFTRSDSVLGFNFYWVFVQDPEKASLADEVDRDNWDNPIEFLLSCVSMSVGLGNVWRFPFTAYENGGGAFLIPYLVVLLLIGRPIYYLEMCIGQFSSSGQVKIWSAAPIFKGETFPTYYKFSQI